MNPNRQPRADADGFTLLEILVALALLALIATALYSTYFTLFKGRETTVAGMNNRRDLRTTLDLMRRELSSTFYIKAVDKNRFVVEDRDQFGKPASRLAFAAIVGPFPTGQVVSDQQVVEYSIVVKDDKMILARSAQDVHRTDKPTRAVQMDEVEGFLVECSSDGTKWVKSWDTNLTTALPKMVRVTIRIKEGEQTAAYSTIATIRMPG